MHLQGPAELTTIEPHIETVASLDAHMSESRNRATEAETVARARAGDNDAWVTLVLEYQQPIFRLAWLLVNNRDEAEEVAQETFVHAFAALKDFDSARPLRPWLLRIAHNLALNRKRSLRRAWRTLQEYFVRNPASEADAGVSQQWHESEALRNAIRRLPADDQPIIYLRYFLEMSVEECAETLEIAPGTVKSRLSRALTRLRPLAAREFGETE